MSTSMIPPIVAAFHPGLVNHSPEVTNTTARLTEVEEGEDISSALKTIIGPAYAAELLKMVDPEQQNALRPWMVDQYALDMKHGKWKVNGDTICISTTNRLIDGQHRLHAIIKSGVPMACLIVYGLDDDAFATKNRGYKRQLHDAFRAAGYSYYTYWPSVTTLMWQYERGVALGIGGTKGVVSFGERELLIARHPGLKASLDFVMKRAGVAHGPFSKRHALFAVVHYLAHKTAPGLANQFINQVVSGSDLAFNSPVLQLRNKLMNTKLDQIVVKQLVFKALNFHLREEKVKQLVLREGEPFPSVVGSLKFGYLVETK